MSRSRQGALSCTALIVLLAQVRLPALDPEKRLTQFVHTAWTPRDGAPSEIRQIVQTPDGFLWLSTGREVYRFDGLRFELWAPPPEWVDRLADGLRGSLLVTSDGALWMSIGAGLARIRDGQFAWMPLPIERRRVVVSLVEEDEHHLLLVAGEDGAYRFNRATGESRRLSAADGLPAGMPFKLWRDRDATIWLVMRSMWKGATSLQRSAAGPGGRYVTENGVVFRPRGHERFQPTDAKLGTVGSFAQASDGTIWVAETARSIRIFRTADGRFLPPSLEVYVGALGLVVDSHGSLWIPSLGDGLRRVADPRALGTAVVGKWAREAEAFTEDHGLSGDVLYDAFEDREGNVWLAGTNGLDRFRDVRLAEFTAKEGVRLNLGSRFAVLAPDDRTGVTVASGTLEGLLFHVTRSGRITGDAVYVDTLVGDFKECVGPAGDSANRVNAIHRAPDGTLWAAGNRLFMRTATASAWRCLPLKSPEGALQVTAMAAARDGGLWLGTSHGELWRYRTDGSLSRTGSAVRQRVTVMLELEDGTVWLGGDGGLARFRNGDVLEVRQPQGLPRGGAYTLFTGSAGDLWVLGPGGLAIVRDGRVVAPVAMNGVPSAGCWSAVRDGPDIWFNCRHGLLKIASGELDAVAQGAEHAPAYVLLDAADDLRSAPIQGATSHSITRSGDGRIWFLTQKGLGYVDPQRLGRPRLPPHVSIASARTAGRTLDVGSSPTLQPLSSDLEIAFTAVSLSHPERLHFRYRLDGADEDWRETRERSVSYDNLSAGDYRLRVIAANYLGVWSDREAMWTFSIAPHWYERWWFRLVVSVFVAVLVWLAAKAGFARQAAGLKREFSVQLEERTRIAGELHDTLLQGFQGATLQLHSLATKLAPGSVERSRLDAVLEELRVVLDDGRKAIWAIRESTLICPDLKTAFTRVADHVGESRPAFHLTEEGRAREMNPVLRDILFQLGREALMNAFQHSHAHNIRMNLRWEPRLFRMTVVDDGVGIADSIRSSGRDGHFGLAGMRERAERLGAAFDLRSAPGSGTEISVSVPARSIYLQSITPWYRRLISRVS